MCPVQWTHSNQATLGTCQSVLIRGVASFQGSRLEGVHCIQRGSHTCALRKVTICSKLLSIRGWLPSCSTRKGAVPSGDMLEALLATLTVKESFERSKYAWKVILRALSSSSSCSEVINMLIACIRLGVHMATWWQAIEYYLLWPSESSYKQKK